MNVSPRRGRKGFVLLEIILALGLLATVATALVLALHRTAELAEKGREEQELSRLMDSCLTDAAMISRIEPTQYDYRLEEMGGVDVKVVIEELQDLQTNEGEETQTLTEMFRVRVFLYFTRNGQREERVGETWRYGRLYQA